MALHVLFSVHLTLLDHAIATADLFVCPSVTFRCFVQTNEDTIVRSSVSGRTISLLYGEVKFIPIFAGITPRESVKVK